MKKLSLKRNKDLSYKNIVFCIYENHKWVAGIYHEGRRIKPVSDKKVEIALMMLCDELYELYDGAKQ